MIINIFVAKYYASTVVDVLSDYVISPMELVAVLSAQFYKSSRCKTKHITQAFPHPRNSN